MTPRPNTKRFRYADITSDHVLQALRQHGQPVPARTLAVQVCLALGRPVAGEADRQAVGKCLRQLDAAGLVRKNGMGTVPIGRHPTLWQAVPVPSGAAHG